MDLNGNSFRTIGKSKSVISGIWKASNFSGNQEFEWELGLLGIPRMSYKGYEQLMILVEIMVSSEN